MIINKGFPESTAQGMISPGRLTPCFGWEACISCVGNMKQIIGKPLKNGVHNDKKRPLKVVFFWLAGKWRF
jgi:hypothetical protein